jgi:chromodomain-helicase-DNA-binding protein 7
VSDTPVVDEEVAAAAPDATTTTTKRKGKKRKTKQEKESVEGEEQPAEPAKKTKRSAAKKKKKKVQNEEIAVTDSASTADLSAVTADTTIDTEASSVTESAAPAAFDEATQEDEAGATDSSVLESTPKGKKGKGKGTPKGTKKPKLKEGKSSAKKKLPKIALAKFKGRKKKRLGDSDHDSDHIEKTPPPSPDETETGIQKRRSGRVTKRTKYLDEVDLDLSADESKKEDDKKEVATVIVDDTMVVEKIMCTRTGTRELEPENEEEEARFKQDKPPTVEVEEFYVKYKNLSYLHCDWRTEEELEKGDKRINQKIKRYKMKKDSNTSYDFLDDEPFNPDYCEVDRILDVNIVTEEIPVPDPEPQPDEKPLEPESEKSDAETAVKPDDEVKSEEKVTSDNPELPVTKSEEVDDVTGDQTDDKADTDDKKSDDTALVAPVTDSEIPAPPDSDASSRVADSDDKKDPASPDAAEKPKKTMTRTTRHYLVKWQALPYEESTWELEDDLDPEKVKQFWRFRQMPPKEVMKHKRRPKASEWKKLDESPVYKNGNTLREYQLEGLNWLTFCWYNNRNCILADEMGLGKTIQSLTFINEMVKFGMHSPFLVIAPLSTIGNWQREFETWTDLNVITYHGSAASRNMITEYEMFFKNEKGEKIDGVYKFQVMITTFEVVLTDCLELREIVWRTCVIDEAHRLKNRNCKLLEGLRLLQMDHRVLLTGTPLQNNVEELFSLLNFLEPVQFSSPETFMQDFGDLKTEEQVEKLQAILKPMMLRRLKEDVEKSLAPKEETIVEVELTNIQKKYYRAILERNFQFLSKGGTYANMPNLMNTMMELRKCCIHPFLINSAEEQITADFKQQHGHDPDSQMKCMVQASGKLVLIDKLLPRLRADGHRVLIFSQMVRCLDILEDYVIQKKYPYERIDGRVRGNMRQAAIDRFSKPGSDRFVFLLCTRAGGLGINLTAADTVIIFDSDWNPQNDLQAQARCHRIGQSKMVKVYRLICRNTYEREMFDKASLKLGLDKAVLQSMNTGQKGGAAAGDANAPLSKKEVEELLRKGAYGAVMDDDNAGDKFCEEDIDQILTRRTQVITIESGEKGSTFSRASFATSDNADIELDDPNFWEKWAKKANIDSEEFVSKNELIVQEPRRRTQTKRFGQDDGVMEMSEADSSDDDDENVAGRTRGGRGRPPRVKKGKRGRGNGYERERDEDYLEDFAPGNWARAECYKVEKALLTYGWGRWEEFLSMGNFRRRLTTQDVEDIARVLLLYSLQNYKGDEKVKSFIFELITPPDQTDKVTGKSPGSCSPTGRGRKGRKASRKTVAEELTSSDWVSSDAHNPEMLLVDEQYRKHLSKQINK